MAEAKLEDAKSQHKDALVGSHLDSTLAFHVRKTKSCRLEHNKKSSRMNVCASSGRPQAHPTLRDSADDTVETHSFNHLLHTAPAESVPDLHATATQLRNQGKSCSGSCRPPATLSAASTRGALKEVIAEMLPNAKIPTP